jgi:polyferredoxin
VDNASSKRERKRNLLEPIFPVSLFFILFFGLKPLMILIGLPDQFLPAVIDGIVKQEPDFAGTVLVAAAVAFFALWTGYVQPLGRKLGKLLWKLAVRVMRREEKRLRLAGIVTLGTVGGASVIYLILFGWIHPALKTRPEM